MKNHEIIYPALRAALTFFVFGFIWILASDEAVHQLSPSHRLEHQLQTYKGWFFISLIAIMIYFIFRKQLKKAIDYKDKMLISERSLSAILENIGEGIISTDKTGNITDINKIAENLIGITKKQAKGQSLFDVVYFVDHEGDDITQKLFDKPLSLMNINEVAVLTTTNGQMDVKVFVNTGRVYNNTGQHTGNIIAFRDITDLYKRDKAVKDSEERFRTIIETALDGFVITGSKGNILMNNDSYSRMIGYSKDELSNMHLSDLRAPEALGELPGQIKSVMEEGKASFETKHQNKQGEIIDVEVSAKFIEEYQSVFVFLKDITKRKRVEEEVSYFKNALDSSTDAIGMSTPEGKHYYQNKTFDEMFGLLGEDPVPLAYADKKIGREVFKTIMGGGEWIGEIVMVGKEKQLLNVFLRAYAVKKNDKIIALVGVHTDITERKMAEAALKEREDRLSKIMLVAIDGMWDWNLVTDDAYFDPRYYQMAGYEVDEFEHRLEEFEKRLHPDDHFLMDQAKKYIKGEIDRFEVEFRFKKKNGDWLWIITHGIIVERDEKGTPTRFVGTHTDITDRKNAEFALRESEHKLRDLLNNLDAGVVVHAADTSITLNNPRASELLGLNDAQMKGKQAIDPEWKFLNESNNVLPLEEYPVNQVISGKKPIKNMLAGVIRAKNKDVVWLLVNGFPVVDSHNDIVEVIISFIDITDRRHSEQAIKESQERFDLAVNATRDGIYDWDLLTNEIYYSPALKSMVGYRDEELSNDLSVWEDLTSAEDVKKTWIMQNELINKERDRFEMEFKMKHKDGHWVDVLSRAEAYFDEEGKAVRVVGTLVDITDRKLAEMALLFSEERFRSFMENSTDASSLYDADLNLIELNKAGLAMFPQGTKKEKLIGKNLSDIDPGIESSDRYKNYQEVIRTGEPLMLNEYIPHPRLGDRYLSVRLFKVGNGLGMIVTDITKQKQSEKALKESEERYKKIVETTHDLIWSCDVQGNILYISDACKHIYGYAPEEMIGQNFSKFLPSNQITEHRKKFKRKTKQQITTIEFDTEIINRNGERFYLKDNITILNDKNGEVTGMMGASKNVTEKVLAEKALLNSMNRLEFTLDSGGLGLWDYNFKSQELLVSDQWKLKLGLRKNAAITPEIFNSLIHPEEIEFVNETFLECLQQQKMEFKIEFRMKHSSGGWKWFLSQGKVMEQDKDGNATRMVGVNLDVTETKQLELELKRWVNIYSSFIKYSSEGIYLFELEEPMPISIPHEEQIKYFYHHGYVKTCNDAFAKMYGYNKAEDLVGIKQSQLHGGEDTPENIEIMNHFIDSGYRIMDSLSKEVDKDGNSIYFSNNVVGIIEDEKLVRTWGSQMNITDRIFAQQALEESEKKYRLLFKTNPVPLVIVDVEKFKFLDINDATEKLLGYSRKEFSKMKLWDIRPDILVFTEDEMKAQMQKGAGFAHESKLVNKSGKTILAEVIFDLIDYDGHPAALAAFSDITALKEAEKRVLKSIIEGEDNERKRVSKELHDSLGQHLTAASLNFDSIKQAIKDLGEKDSVKYETGLDFLKSAIEESRNIAHNLMPKAIDDFGLIPSLYSLFNKIEKSTGINVKFYENLGEGRLNRQIELNLYRITQEAINNVIKHAKATEVFIQLVLHKKEIIFTFEDNGIGFDKSRSEVTGKGMGLQSIFNRVKAMAGIFELDARPKKGTSITIEIPV